LIDICEKLKVYKQMIATSNFGKNLTLLSLYVRRVVPLVFIELMYIIPCFPQTRICSLNNNYLERVKGYIRGMQV